MPLPLYATLRFALLPYLLPLAACASALSASQSIATDLSSSIENFSPFTGRITGHRVRLRAAPSLDSAIVHEFSRHALLHVVGEDEEFYQVTPPEEIKGYVFRSYVLDGVIEGNRVNIRAEPSTDSPILGQLDQGQTISGAISQNNPKWLEIGLPEGIKFYVAKEFVDHAGPEAMVLTYEEKRKALPSLLNAADFLAQSEMSKDFASIDYAKIQNSFENILSEFGSFKELNETILRSYHHVQDQYLTKKIAHLESRAQETQSELSKTAVALAENTFSAHSYGDFIDAEVESANAPAEAVIEVSSTAPSMVTPPSNPSSAVNFIPESHWSMVEMELFQKWKGTSAHNEPLETLDQYYRYEQERAKVLCGTVESYLYPLAKRPGDYLLRDSHGVPLAYLYSTRCDLNLYAGKQARFYIAQRPNHSYALPAYYVLAVHAAP
jgi:hypothetical protein